MCSALQLALSSCNGPLLHGHGDEAPRHGAVGYGVNPAWQQCTWLAQRML